MDCCEFLRGYCGIKSNISFDSTEITVMATYSKILSGKFLVLYLIWRRAPENIVMSDFVRKIFFPLKRISAIPSIARPLACPCGLGELRFKKNFWETLLFYKTGIALDFWVVLERSQQYTVIYPFVTVYLQLTFSVTKEVDQHMASPLWTANQPRNAQWLCFVPISIFSGACHYVGLVS